MVVTARQNNNTIITLLPNRSASWAETRLFLFLLCGTTLAIGVFWAFVGAWVILPFAGLEAGLAAYFIYRVCQATYQRQVVICSAETILVQCGCRCPNQSWQLQRDQTRLSLAEPENPLDAAELSIYDHHHHIVLGYFLNQQDKQQALAEFKRLGLLVRRYQTASEPQ